MIAVDRRNPTAVRYAEELASLMPEGWHDPDVDLIIGGDGFLLHTVAEHGFERALLGLNAGRIGFLLNDVGVWETTVEQLRRRAWTVYALPVIEARIFDGEGREQVALAVNDVVLERATGQTAHLRLSIDGREVVDRLVADGLIFATALGSTAYTFSAGGPACHPTLDVLAVTAICPHKPRLAPILVPTTSRAVVEVHDPDRRPVRATADGLAFGGVQRLEICVSDRRVKIAWLEGHDLTARMVAKIVRP